MDEEEITTCSNSAIEWNEISREIQVNGNTNTILKRLWYHCTLCRMDELEPHGNEKNMYK